MAVSSETALKAPRSLGRPKQVDDGFWDETQWAVFMAVMDTIVPAIVSKSSLADKTGQLGIPDVQYSTTLKEAQATVMEKSDRQCLEAFMSDRPSTNNAVRASLVHIISRLSPLQRARLGGFMSRLSYVCPRPRLCTSCLAHATHPL